MPCDWKAQFVCERHDGFEQVVTERDSEPSEATEASESESPESSEDDDVNEWRSDRSDWDSSEEEDDTEFRFGAPINLFELIDADANNKVSIFEFFSMFVAMDSENDYQVTADELIQYLISNEDTICRPYEAVVDLMLE